MTPDELCRLPAVAAARQIADRTLSPIALMDAILDRANRLDPVLHVFAHPMFEAARRGAEQAEAAVQAGAALGPLHGVPITIKDNIAVAGVPMRSGSAALPSSLPLGDGLTVRRVRSAGAIVIGKTTLPELAHKVLTDNQIDGVTRNPWRLSHTPGGSSGGASAALAAGIAPLAVGTDGGGSIRCPASCTGTVGLKPTLGRVPNETAPDAFGNFFFVGPMARTAADVRLLLSVLEGPDSADPYAHPSPVAPRRRGPLRIGVIEPFGEYGTDPAVATLVHRALDHLAAQGATLHPLQPACFNGLFAPYQVLATTAHATRFGHLLDTAPDRLTASMRDSITIGRRWSGTDLLAAQDRRTVLFRTVQALFDQVDVLATATMTALRPASTSAVPTACGIVGWSEFNESPGSAGLCDVIGRLAPLLVGKDPRPWERIATHLRIITRQSNGGLLTQALAAIENAVLDIVAKDRGVPVYALFGGPVRERLPLYWSHAGVYRVHHAALMGVDPIATYDELARHAAAIRDQGFRCLKTNIIPARNGHLAAFAPGFGLTPGWPELNWDASMVQATRNILAALREGAGPKMGLMLDTNFHFKTEGFVRIAAAAEPYDLTWLEIDSQDPAALAYIRSRAPCPIASCETLGGRRDFKPFFEQYAVDVPIIDVGWNGLAESLKIAAMAEAYELNVAPHNFHGHLCTMHKPIFAR